jgi:hypothetical protein
VKEKPTRRRMGRSLMAAIKGKVAAFTRRPENMKEGDGEKRGRKAPRNKKNRDQGYWTVL